MRSRRWQKPIPHCRRRSFWNEKNAFYEKLLRRNFSTTRSADQAPSARYGATKTYVKHRTTTSTENGHKTTSKPTYHNMLLSKATITSKPGKYTTIRRVYDTGWNPMNGERGTKSSLQNKTTISYQNKWHQVIDIRETKASEIICWNLVS